MAPRWVRKALKSALKAPSKFSSLREELGNCWNGKSNAGVLWTNSCVDEDVNPKKYPTCPNGEHIDLDVGTPGHLWDECKQDDEDEDDDDDDDNDVDDEDDEEDDD